MWFPSGQGFLLYFLHPDYNEMVNASLMNLVSSKNMTIVIFANSLLQYFTIQSCQYLTSNWARDGDVPRFFSSWRVAVSMSWQIINQSPPIGKVFVSFSGLLLAAAQGAWPRGFWCRM